MKTTTLAEQAQKDFPILQKKIRGKNLVYLDNSATSLTPTPVVEAMSRYYQEYRANVHRSIHSLGEQATAAYTEARNKVAAFINASSSEEIIFTRGTTESINIIARALTKKLQKGDEILLTQMEHHSNLVPWLEIAREKNLNIHYIKLTPDGCLDEQSIKDLLTKKTKIVALTFISNVLGTINAIKTIAAEAHRAGAYCVVDAAQAVPHIPVDVQALDCDVLCFSGHKMYGPTGIGVLYAKKELLEQLEPVLFGGDMINEVSFTKATWNELPWKFEAGTPNIAGAIGLGSAVDYLQSLGEKNIQKAEEELTTYALQELKKINGLQLFGPTTAQQRSPVFSFTLNNIHSHDIAAILDQEGIAVRGGHLCAMPLVQEVLKVNDVCRASFAFYNTTKDVDALVAALKKVQEIFKQ